MKKVNQVVQKIEKHYVSDNCAQVMVPYQHGITILDSNDILYQHELNSPFHINKYLQDDRRYKFPYHTIPTHHSKKGDNYYIFVNQLFDFEKPYIIIRDGIVSESFVVKDNKEALMVNNMLAIYKETIFLNRKELEQFLVKTDSNMHIIHSSGTIYSDRELISEEQILFNVKQKMYDELEQYEKFKGFRDYFSEESLKYFKESIDSMTIEKIHGNVSFIDDHLVLVKKEKENILVNILSITFIKPNCYRITVLELPIVNYTLEQLKFLSPKIFKSSEPKISLILNPTVTKQQIDESKRLVKRIKKYGNFPKTGDLDN